MQSKYSRSQPVERKVARFRRREAGMSVREICELFGMSRKTSTSGARMGARRRSKNKRCSQCAAILARRLASSHHA